MAIFYTNYQKTRKKNPVKIHASYQISHLFSKWNNGHLSNEHTFMLNDIHRSLLQNNNNDNNIPLLIHIVIPFLKWDCDWNYLQICTSKKNAMIMALKT